jgi:hypothetical protein
MEELHEGPMFHTGTKGEENKKEKRRRRRKKIYFQLQFLNDVPVCFLFLHEKYIFTTCTSDCFVMNYA